MSDPSVVIVGAGPLGLTAALLRGPAVVRVTVLAAEAQISSALRVDTFHPPTLDMLAPYSITPRVLEAGLICPPSSIYMHPTRARAVFDLSVVQGETDHPYCDVATQNSRSPAAFLL